MEAIIVFQKNAVLGKVKTRLAAGIGDEKALEIYRFLTQHTHQLLCEYPAQKFLFWSDQLEQDESLQDYQFRVQQGDDLGQRMLNAFESVFALGYTSVVIIGTDCYEMKVEHIKEAFEGLHSADYVFGPALDGGYYLLACRKAHPSVFLNKTWSHDQVLQEAKNEIKQLGLSLNEIESLSDIDTVDDLGELQFRFQL